MNMHRTTIAIPLASLLAFAALGGCKKEETTETAPDSTPDPLTGDWSADICFGSEQKPTDVETCKTSLSFNEDLTFTMEAEWVNRAASPTEPGCTTKKRVTGQKWSTDRRAGTLNITGDSQATMQRVKCVNETDNLQTTTARDIGIPAGKYRYSVDGDMLHIDSGPLRGEYRR